MPASSFKSRAPLDADNRSRPPLPRALSTPSTVPPPRPQLGKLALQFRRARFRRLPPPGFLLPRRLRCLPLLGLLLLPLLRCLPPLGLLLPRRLGCLPRR